MLVIVLVVIVLTFKMRTRWWAMTDVFFIFMAVFAHLMALMLGSYSPVASRKLDMAALVCLCLGVLALIGEYVAFQFIV